MSDFYLTAEVERLKADCARMGSLIQDFADRIGVPVADVVAGFDALLANDQAKDAEVARLTQISAGSIKIGYYVSVKSDRDNLRAECLELESFNLRLLLALFGPGFVATDEEAINAIVALKAELADVVSIIRPRVPSAWTETSAVRCAQEAMRSLDILNAALCDCVRKNQAENSAEDRQIETQAVESKGDTA